MRSDFTLVFALLDPKINLISHQCFRDQDRDVQYFNPCRYIMILILVLVHVVLSIDLEGLALVFVGLVSLLTPLTYNAENKHEPTVLYRCSIPSSLRFPITLKLDVTWTCVSSRYLGFNMHHFFQPFPQTLIRLKKHMNRAYLVRIIVGQSSTDDCSFKSLPSAQG